METARRFWLSCGLALLVASVAFGLESSKDEVRKGKGAIYVTTTTSTVSSSTFCYAVNNVNAVCGKRRRKRRTIPLLEAKASLTQEEFDSLAELIKPNRVSREAPDNENLNDGYDNPLLQPTAIINHRNPRFFFSTATSTSTTYTTTKTITYTSCTPAASLVQACG